MTKDSIQQLTSVESDANDIVKAALTIIPPADKIMGQFGSIQTQIEKAAEKANLVKVVDAQDKATADAYARLLHPVVKKLDQKRLQLTREIKKRLIDPINNTMTPCIKTGQAAVDHLNGEIQAFHRREIEKQQEAQRKADAEAERRRKLQQAAIDRGGHARQEIVAEEVPVPEVVTEDTSSYWRLTYEITDAEAVPREFCKPDPGLIRAAVTEVEKQFDKDQKGLKEPPQSIPGVKIQWQQLFRRA